MIQKESKDIKVIREKYHDAQNRICPILNQEFDVSEMVVDHAHSRNSKVLGTNDGGLIRGVIQRQANVIEGKLTNSFIRYGLHKFGISIPEFLRRLADYIENPPLAHLRFKHPIEIPREPILSKRSFNKLAKRYTEVYPKRKSLEYPKSKKLTKYLSEIYKEFEIEPEFLK